MSSIPSYEPTSGLPVYDPATNLPSIGCASQTPPTPCTDCPSLPASVNYTVSGFSGSCAFLNKSGTMTAGPHAGFVGDPFGFAFMFCQDDGTIVFTLYHDDGLASPEASATIALDDDGCPILGTYMLAGKNAVGFTDCSGQTGTVVLS